MGLIRDKTKQDTAGPIEPAPVFLDARSEFAARFLAGEGLEIGALHQPLKMPPQAKPRYVDRLTVEDLRSEYPELAGWDLTEVDVIDNGELLETIPEESQDFIVANHFLEHCEDPIRTIGTHLGKLRPGGVLFYAVPDKRYTFDYHRDLTPLEHMIADNEEGPERSRREHYEQWSRRLVVEEGRSEKDAVAHARELEAAKYSIHMHVWTQAEFLNLIIHCRAHYDDAFDIEAAARQGIEFVVILRKQGTPPAAATPAPPPAGFATGVRRKLRAKLSR
jgi:SAM-dependent methyltransferase